MKHKASEKPLRYLMPALTVGLIFSLFVAVLAMNITSLNSQVESLDNKVSAAEKQLATYKRTLCNNTFAVSAPNVTTKHAVESAGYTRTYQVHTPSDYDASVRYPVILSFDGIDGSGAQMESYSGLDSLPAIVVYPDSLMSKANFTAWQGAPYSIDGDRDTSFVQEILDTLPSQYCIDTNKIYATGMSNGGSFATIVGCRFGDHIQAVASVSGAYYTSCESEQRTPSLLAIHSTEDNRVYFMGDASRGLPAVSQWVRGQVEGRGCKASTASVQSNTETYSRWSKCEDDSVVQFVVLHGQPHGWVAMPQAAPSTAQSTADYIWKFFEESTRAQ